MKVEEINIFITNEFADAEEKVEEVEHYMLT